jgi:hypothetical protein
MTQKDPPRFLMVLECVDRYEVRQRPDGGAQIVIEVPQRFANLWKLKLSELRASGLEIDESNAGS